MTLSEGSPHQTEGKKGHVFGGENESKKGPVGIATDYRKETHGMNPPRRGNDGTHARPRIEGSLTQSPYENIDNVTTYPGRCREWSSKVAIVPVSIPNNESIGLVHTRSSETQGLRSTLASMRNSIASIKRMLTKDDLETNEVRAFRTGWLVEKERRGRFLPREQQ